MSLQKTKEIDQRTQDIVFGYIRAFNLQSIIPKDIFYLCLLFYYLIPEQFILADEELDIVSSDEDKSKIRNIAKLKRSLGWKWMMIHGNLIVDPQENPDIVVEWTVKINIRYCCIGINSLYQMGDETMDYRWYGAIDASGTFGEGDLIKMVLDIPKQELIYYRNGELSKKRFDGIDTEERYHLTLKVHSSKAVPGDGVELMDFNVKGHKCLAFRADE